MAKKPTNTFEVMGLAEASTEYNGLIEKRQELEKNYRELNAERSKLRKEIEAAKAAGGQRLTAGVARLLGESAEDSVTALSLRLREVVVEMSDSEAATEVIRRRLSDARDRASKVICDGVRQEYQRRLGAMCDAARALEAARQDHDELLDGLDREDVRKDYLQPVRAHFVGDGKVGYFLKEVREHGYNV